VLSGIDRVGENGHKVTSMTRLAVWIIAFCGLAVVAQPQGVGTGDLTCTVQLNCDQCSIITTDPRSVSTLNNGQFLVTDIYLCDGTWRVSPRMTISSGQKLTVVGRFKQEATDSDSRLFGNPWIGRIESAPVELTLGQRCITSLNSKLDKR
jgi:hypothetical protein